jgi:hypothetical protein
VLGATDLSTYLDHFPAKIGSHADEVDACLAWVVDKVGQMRGNQSKCDATTPSVSYADIWAKGRTSAGLLCSKDDD